MRMWSRIVEVVPNAEFTQVEFCTPKIELRYKVADFACELPQLRLIDGSQPLYFLI